MPVTLRHTDLTGRIVALLVFLLGVGLLAFVFSMALHLFRNPTPGLSLSPAAAAPQTANIGTALALFLRQLLLLALMTVAGSVIAGKGIHLYFGTMHWVEPSSGKNGLRGAPAAQAAEEPAPEPRP